MQEIQINLINPDGERTICWTWAGKNLREVIALNHHDPGGSCGGRVTCGKCKVRVKGDVSPLTAQEREFLLPEELRLGLRLACFCTIQGPLNVYLDYAPAPVLKPIRKLKNYHFRPLVKTETFFISGLDKSEPVPLLKRINNALPGYAVRLTPRNINDLSVLDREGRPSLELKALVFNQQEVRYVGREKRNAYGIALDIGTTSLFAMLVNLENGEAVQVASATNMQRVYGSDVISRISYCQEKASGLEELHMILINNINSLIAELMEKSQLNIEDLIKFTVVGNPVMLHLFLGISVKGFAAAPYSGFFIDAMHIKASTVGVEANKDAEMFILPQIGGFVGADTIACLLNISHQVRKYLLIDIGTNGEIVLGDGKNFWAASAAAGPAFEGGRIGNGMRAGPGAVDQIAINSEGLLEINIIGDAIIKGICGSGIIDLASVLRQEGYIDEYGIIDLQSNYNQNIQIQNTNDGPKLTIIDRSSESSFTFTQQDIRELQLAKAAIRTGIDILLRQAEMDAGDLEAVFLAGAFGNVLKAESCINIGLIPPVDPNKIFNIGNAAAEGAYKALLSDNALAEANAWQSRISYTELASQEDFQDLFIRNINF